nr:RecName: Full=Myo-inositol-binding protein [Pseudomonas sp.]
DMKIGVSMSQFDDTHLTYLQQSMDEKAKSYPDGVVLL